MCLRQRPHVRSCMASLRCGHGMQARVARRTAHAPPEWDASSRCAAPAGTMPVRATPPHQPQPSRSSGPPATDSPACRVGVNAPTCSCSGHRHCVVCARAGMRVGREPVEHDDTAQLASHNCQEGLRERACERNAREERVPPRLARMQRQEAESVVRARVRGIAEHDKLDQARVGGVKSGRKGVQPLYCRPESGSFAHEPRGSRHLGDQTDQQHQQKHALGLRCSLPQPGHGLP
mmetsp:Transcript_43215/g.137442  ORF Transcript_43215/g.137442 Transcript_43215/m.137442 type:complete len:234 (+) Transcript_43215:34-735(+)